MDDKVTRLHKGDKLSQDTRPDAAKLVMDWLKNAEKTEDGRVTASLSVISEATKLKYSTVSRALHRLEAMGLIRLLPRESPKEPNTVQLMKDVEAVRWNDMRQHLHEVSAGLDIAEGYVVKLQEEIKRLEAEVAELKRKAALLEGEVTETKELPGGFLMVLVKK